jgi:kumamolisin
MSTPKNRFSLAGSERAPLEGAREIGPANPNKTVDVTIRLRSRAGKKPIVSSDEFTKPIEKRTILSRKEIEQRRGADPKSIDLVESFASD